VPGFREVHHLFDQKVETSPACELEPNDGHDDDVDPGEVVAGVELAPLAAAPHGTATCTCGGPCRPLASGR
jgi:hypothetical protein